ncbi:MAG: MotA/TolQ/ExbB proton channel family protein [Treponema sp.]|jgi:biopolymer transport protein ExbB|nr:MotA/TolQ/ExbB proton channel family protein [Treponema sp.]
MEAQNMSFSLLELFMLGGVFMWPLLFFSIATITISLERFIYFFSHSFKMDDLKAKVESCIPDNKIEEAREYLSSLTKKRIGAPILLALVNHSDLSEHQMERAAETEASSRITSLESGFNFLIALGSLSPLTGFLGTVSGMISAFRSIAEATEVNAQIVANGIYEALITTVFGLIIAIIAMVAYSLLSHLVDRFAADTEKACSELITEFAIRSERAAKKAAETAAVQDEA